MPEAIKAGAICIDCHKGIAHHFPKELAEPKSWKRNRQDPGISVEIFGVWLFCNI